MKGTAPISTTAYIRDASGNPMETTIYTNASSTTTHEQPLYGSGRLGMLVWTETNGASAPASIPSPNTRALGQKQYELSNHLGNVLAVITDAKFWDAQKNAYLAVVVSATDYYPFGMAMDGRSYSSDAYRYGFNGKENDKDFGNKQLIQDYGFRLYNPAIGKFLSVDPLAASYPWYTPYQFAGNKPIKFIDLDGAEEELHDWDFDPEDITYYKGGWVRVQHKGKSFLFIKNEYNVYEYVQELSEATIHYDRRLAPKIKQFLLHSAKEVAKEGARQLELENAKIIVTGTNLDGEEESRAAASAGIVIALAGGKILKFIGRGGNAIWRASSKLFKKKPKYLYRGDARPPKEIAEAGGFHARGDFDDLAANVKEAHPESAFIATSEEEWVAKLFAKDAAKQKLQGYVYKIRNPGNGIDVNDFFKSQGKDSPYPWQKEWAFGDIPLKYIESAKVIRRGVDIGTVPIPKGINNTAK